MSCDARSPSRTRTALPHQIASTARAARRVPPDSCLPLACGCTSRHNATGLSCAAAARHDGWSGPDCQEARCRSESGRGDSSKPKLDRAFTPLCDGRDYLATPALNALEGLNIAL